MTNNQQQKKEHKRLNALSLCFSVRAHEKHTVTVALWSNNRTKMQKKKLFKNLTLYKLKTIE